jgi:O-antigen/teichoic acid export membrane protein
MKTTRDPGQDATWKLFGIHFAHHSFARKVLVLAGGTAAGQLLSLLAVPLIARLYTPADYGILGIYMSALGLMVPVAALRFESGVPGAESDSVAARLIIVALTAVVLSGMVITLSLVVLGPRLEQIGTLKPLIPFAWLVPLGVTLAGAYQSFTFWCIRKQDFRVLSTTKIAQGAGMVSAQLLLGIGHRGPLGLLVGHMIGQSSGITTLMRRIFSKDRGSFQHINPGKLVDTARQYHRFPKLSVAALLLETSSVHLPLLLFATGYGVTVMGWVSLVTGVISAPLGVLAANIGQVYFAELAELKRSDPRGVPRAFLRRLWQLVLFGTSLTTLAVVFGSFLIPVFFGQPWKNSALCLQLWSPVILFGFVAAPFGWVLDALQRQDLHLARGVLRLILPAIAVAAAHFLRLGWVSAFSLLSGAIGLSYILYVWISWLAVTHFSYNIEKVDPAVSAEVIAVQDASIPFVM